MNDNHSIFLTQQNIIEDWGSRINVGGIKYDL